MNHSRIVSYKRQDYRFTTTFGFSQAQLIPCLIYTNKATVIRKIVLLKPLNRNNNCES